MHTRGVNHREIVLVTIETVNQNKDKKMSKALDDNFIKTESSTDSSTLSRFKDLNLSSEKNDIIENTHLPEYIRIKAVGQGTSIN